MITDSQRGCGNNLKREKMKEEDMKHMGQVLGQVLDNKSNSGEGASLRAGSRGVCEMQRASQ